MNNSKTTLKINKQQLGKIVEKVIEEILFNTLPKHDPCGDIYSTILDSKPYLLDEGLIQSYPIERVVSVLKSLYKLYDGNNKKEQNKILYFLDRGQNYSDFNGIIFLNEYSQNNTQRIEIKVNENDFNQEDFDRYLLKYGWYCGISEKQYGYDNIVRFIYEKKFDIDITELVKERRFIYHICPNVYLNKINRVGLKPKISSWNQFKNPERVYFFIKEITHDEFLKWAYDFNWEKNVKRELNHGWSLLKIDTLNLTNNPVFYFDPRMKNGVYTMDSISPKNIEVIDFIDTNTLLI